MPTQALRVSEDVVGLASNAMLDRLKVVPIEERGKRVLVAVNVQPDLEKADSLEFILGRPIECCLVSDSELRELWADYQEKAKQKLPQGFGKISEGRVTFEDNFSVENLASSLFAEAVSRGASDIHLEPKGNYLQMRCRLDGKLQLVRQAFLPKSLVGYLKLQASMDIDQKRHPQDGRLSWEGRDVRVSVIPTTNGESMVLRILNKEALSIQFGELGLSSKIEKKLHSMLFHREGLILATGPTGSGKTTTLYSMLTLLRDAGKKIITVEDPVEYRIEGINQVSIKDRSGMTFASALRSILRQSPDVIMAGEIRDLETAKIVIEASLTGHLVLSTLHTNNASGAFSRLIDLGIEPYNVASALKVVLGQRLIRKICSYCKTQYSPKSAELATLGLNKGRYYHGIGCKHCEGKGLKGRIGLFEFWEINETISDSLIKGYSRTDTFFLDKLGRFSPLKSDGIDKIQSGLTTIEEVAAATL